MKTLLQTLRCQHSSPKNDNYSFRSILVLIFSFFLLSQSSFAQNVGIGTTTPDASAMLDVSASDKGLLVPRMASTERNSISNPATGLLVYQNDSPSGFYLFDGSNWKKLAIETNNQWGLSGNSGTTNGSDFIGTTDNQDLDIRSNNVIRVRITTQGQIEVLNTGKSVFLGEAAGENDDLSDNNNTFIGYESGNRNTTGIDNTATGYQALYYNISGEKNTVVGRQALYSNQTGNRNSVLGTYSLYANTEGHQNTASGFKSLYSNTIGNYNTSYGDRALYSNITGEKNTAFGHVALFNNSDRSGLVAVGDSALYNNGIGATDDLEAIKNTAVGSQSLFSNTTGTSNSAIGNKTLYSNIDGVQNTAMGANALQKNTTGSVNSAFGAASMYHNTTGEMNAAFGRWSLFENKYGDENTALGYKALKSDTTGSNNTAIGTHALYWNKHQSHLVAVGDSALFTNTYGATESYHGVSNTALGSCALKSNTIGRGNTATGYHSLYNNSSGILNTANGGHSLESNISGKRNTAIGEESMYQNDYGNDNTAIGFKSLYSNGSGYGNVASGEFALYSNTSGKYNQAMGLSALYSNTLGDRNVAIGNSALYSNTSKDNLIAIGDSALYYNGVGASGNEATGNTATGDRAMLKNTKGYYNSVYGKEVSYHNETGNNNTIIGYNADYYNNGGSRNTIIGSEAGKNTKANNKSGNILIGYQAGINMSSDNKLYIENSSSNAPLIYGDFASDQIGINGTLGVGTETPQTELHIIDGSDTDSDVKLRMQSDGANNDAIIEFYENTAAAMSMQYDGGDNSLYLIDLTQATPSKRVTFERDGKVGIGTTSPDELLHIDGGKLKIGSGETLEDGGAYEIAVNSTFRPTEDDTRDLGTSSYRWDNVYATNGTIQTSDIRDKENIKPVKYGLNEVLQLKPVSFTWKNKAYQGEKLGLIAQDLLKVIPEVVKTEDWKQNEETGQNEKVELERLGVYYSYLIPVLVKAVQEQQQIINDQNQKIEDLTKRLDNLEGK